MGCRTAKRRVSLEPRPSLSQLTESNSEIVHSDDSAIKKVYNSLFFVVCLNDLFL